MVDRCCSAPPEFGVLAPTAALKSTRERPLATDHDLELLRSPATDLPTGQYNVGGTGECTGAPCQDHRLRHIPAAAELWNPPPATNVCALSVWCGPHLCTSSYFCRSRPPLTHLQCHPSPSGFYHPRCHPPHLLVGPPHHSHLQISGLPRGNRGTECGRPVYSGGPAHVRHLCLMCATCCALSSLWDH